MKFVIVERAKLTYAKASVSEGGAGGSRTRVQTRKQQAFYMLSPDLIFVFRLAQGHRPKPYSL